MATVVIVDDSPTAIALLQTVLRHMGHSVVQATDGPNALELVQSHRPQLLISDVLMPILDGYGLVQQVRANPGIANTPVILWTATYLASEVTRLAKPLGVQRVLTKPCEPEALIEAINSVLNAPPTSFAVNPPVATDSVHLEHLQAVSVRLRDKVSEQVAELEAGRRELETTDLNYQLLFDNHPSLMYLIDSETLAFLDVNEAAYWRYGYTRVEFLALKVTDIASPEEMLAASASAARGESILRSGPWTHRTKNGTTFQAETTAYDLVFHGRPARFVSAEDVTEKRRLERVTRQSQRLESLGLLAGGVAHDFNNLLAVILNLTFFVKQKLAAVSGEPAGQEWVPVLKDAERIERAAQSAARLTRQLLVFARREVVQPQALDINLVVLEIEPLLRRTICEHVEFVTVPGKDMWPALIDPGQFEQILTNLVVNACDATGSGGKVTVDTQNLTVDEAYAAGRPGLEPGRYVQLRVSDAGVGMSPETLEHVFEPFFTTKPTGQGTGLGLSTVHGIAKQAGGYVAIYSELGVGSRVTVLLPATDLLLPTPAEVDSKSHEPASGVIMVVEDSDDLRDVIERILTRTGYKVIVAASGPEALEAARRHEGHIDLLLTDVIMPQMPGTEVAKQMASLWPGIRVLFMSGYAQPMLGSSGKLEPGVALLEKPFVEPVLLARVREVLQTPPMVPSPTVLVVEDFEDLRSVIEETLLSAGYRVLVTRDGSSALKAARDHVGSIDVLFTDITLPEMLGTELAKALEPSRPEMRVLFMSGYPDPHLRANAPGQPAIPFIQKPFSVPELLQKMREVLEVPPAHR